MIKPFIFNIFLFLCCMISLSAQRTDEVKMHEGTLQLPTYVVGAPEKAPSFSRHFAFQRARRGVYPYAMNDNITDKKEVKTYKALFLENEYVEMCVLPEIGGRLFYAIDKTNGYDIFYHQHVIKPSNVGMLGAWISGGVEFNVFHHHRATSQIPVDYKLVSNADGSKTIWVGEFEPRQRMAWAVGLTLYPGKSYIEMSGRLINQTADTNSILYWSNVSTSVNKDYQVIFPPSTDFGVYHAKNSFCHWPVTHETFDGFDCYKNGIDASWWKNHPNPISIFAYDKKGNFIAGIDHGKHAGTMLVGDDNIIKGGKLWQWGPGKYGAFWDSKVLTDSDGPYCELMVSAYSDNQPDYSWLMPYETKTFTQYWYGIRQMEGVKAGNEHVALNMDVNDGRISLAANATEKMDGAKITVTDGGRTIYSKVVSISPDAPFSASLKAPSKVVVEQLCMTIFDASGKELISYKPVVKEANKPLPETVSPPKQPKDIANNEELYFVGLRNKQFHQAFVDYMDYFNELLRRDAYDTRANTQAGIYYRENGDDAQALMHLRRAVMRQTKDYTRPADGEAMYNLGLVLKSQAKYEEAIDTLSRASWDYAFCSASNYQLGQIYAIRKNYLKAVDVLGTAITYNGANLEAKNLKCTLLRTLGKNEEAKAMAKEVIQSDPLNPYATLESVKLGLSDMSDFEKLMRDQPESYLEVAVSYMNNGFPDEAESLLKQVDSKVSYPTVKFYLGYLMDLKGDKTAARSYFDKAVAASSDYCFPFRLETVKVYEKALEYLPDNANVCYYMGNLLFDKQPDTAMEWWQRSVKANPRLAMAWRNLGWGYKFHVKDNVKAIENYEKAISIDPSEATFYDELDEVYEASNVDVQKRCDMLHSHHDIVCHRYAPLVREIRMLTATRQYDTAIKYLTTYYFSRQEGVNDLHDVHVDACLLAGKQKMDEKKPDEAYKYFLLADEYPENQWVNREDDYARNAQIWYMTAQALEAMGKKSEADKLYKQAAQLDTKDTNYAYYRVLALRKAGLKADTAAMGRMLVSSGQSKVTSRVDNFFVSFGPGRTEAQVNTEAYYTQALGHLILGEKSEAADCLQKAVNAKSDNLWAGVLLNDLK
jgi:tetratricopeptide (TPR) repeat protein